MDGLPNPGDKSRQVLEIIGITSRRQLALIGPVAAYAMAKRSGANVSLNLLRALEGALTDIHWHEAARIRRTALRLALESYETLTISHDG